MLDQIAAKIMGECHILSCQYQSDNDKQKNGRKFQDDADRVWQDAFCCHCCCFFHLHINSLIVNILVFYCWVKCEIIYVSALKCTVVDIWFNSADWLSVNKRVWAKFIASQLCVRAYAYLMQVLSVSTSELMKWKSEIGFLWKNIAFVFQYRSCDVTEVLRFSSERNAVRYFSEPFPHWPQVLAMVAVT